MIEHVHKQNNDAMNPRCIDCGRFMKRSQVAAKQPVSTRRFWVWASVIVVLAVGAAWSLASS